MKRTLLLLPLVLCGCSSFRVTQTDESPETRKITTTITATAWFSSANNLTKIKAITTDKTQSFGTATLGQQGDTNMIAVLQALARIAEAVRPTP